MVKIKHDSWFGNSITLEFYFRCDRNKKKTMLKILEVGLRLNKVKTLGTKENIMRLLRAFPWLLGLKENFCSRK